LTLRRTPDGKSRPNRPLNLGKRDDQTSPVGRALRERRTTEKRPLKRRKI